MPDWHEPDPGQKDSPLHKIKMKCGCWTYYQRGSGYGIYTLLVSDKCQRDHELAVGPQTDTAGPGVKLDGETTLFRGTKTVATELERITPPDPSRN